MSLSVCPSTSIVLAVLIATVPGFHGCHHKHFQVKPRVIDSQSPEGLIVGKERGVHDGDYYLEVNVTNRALLSTSLRYKISIDVTPPHEGVVHDGVRGSPEVDFQQDFFLIAHWDGFFDRESGVLFYRYSFSWRCLEAHEFHLNSTNQSVTQTYSTHATYQADSEGTYYVTVVAYNRAMDGSDPVCSDGVTVDRSPPEVKEIIIENIRMGEGLVKGPDNTNVWFFQKEGSLVLVQNSSEECRNKSTLLNNLSLYPVKLDSNGRHLTVPASVCNTSKPALVPVLGILPKTSQMEISWTCVEGRSGIHDYEIGLSSVSNSGSPDRLHFVSTKQHRHVRIPHPNIPQGSRFYVILKAISKAGIDTSKSIGPVIVDDTHPEYTGEIGVSYADGFLVARWPNTSVVDIDHGPYPLQYTVAIGHSSASSEVLAYRPLSAGRGCTLTSPPTCTAISTADLPWSLHGHHVYYVSVKVENLVGLSTVVTSRPYIHDIQLPSHGIIVDINTQEADDIDFQSVRDELGARWYGFSHPHLQVQYSVGVGTRPNVTDVHVEYVNARFEDGILQQGKRYMICVHADETSLEYEKWTEVLPEISSCSDGVVIDLTDPTPGTVWIGVEKNFQFQTSSTDMTVTWDSFIDIEEESQTLHSSGITTYQVAIGTSPGGVDIRDYSDVGVTNHVTFHNLTLQNGHSYYASVKGVDFVKREAIAVSAGIIIDDTPPVKSDRPVIIKGRHLTSTYAVSACWEGVFEDSESGIEQFSWAIGSRPDYDDVMDYTATSDLCESSDPNTQLHMHEGHAYYINVRALNKAGLSSLATSWAFVLDTSPPVSGHVYDGKVDDLDPGQSDVDYQTDMNSLYARWEGFHDAHSAIKEYYVSIGTCPHCEDILTAQPIGIAEEFYVDHIVLSAGLTYYVTVMCCNTADLCTTMTSDGVTVDKSPPSPGRVLDGTEEIDIQYQASNDSLGAKWYGFSDPQSGLLKYEVRAGSTPGAGDILAPITLHLTEEVFWPRLPSNTQLPPGQHVYTTVRAYNPKGLYSEATSNGFIVDASAPIITSIPQLSSGVGSLVSNSLIYRTSMKIEWDVQDKESYIQRQYISMATHQGGNFSTESTEVGGTVRDYVFTNLELHDGSIYYVKLIACNLAKLCTESVSSGILVDSSQPTPGMYAVKHGPRC
ncbi:hypothetical protein ScPMuIL_015796 [Solemya velum]